MFEGIVTFASSSAPPRDRLPRYPHHGHAGMRVSESVHGCRMRLQWGTKSMALVHTSQETWVTVIGKMSEINTGFAAAVEAAGWRCQEASDIETLLAQPARTRTVIVVPIPTATMTLYRAIRQITRALDLPVVIFCRTCTAHIVRMTLRAGAEEVIPIPVTIEEAIARLRAVIRVRFDGQRSGIGCTNYAIDEAARTVKIADGPAIHLSATEYRLLRILLATPNHTVTRERLSLLLATPVQGVSDRALNALVCGLRQKLGARRLLTVRGVGYQLIDQPS